MKTKIISEMTNDELTKVFHANEKLREKIYSDMVDNQMDHISDQLDYLRGGMSDWSIGIASYNYINVGSADVFMDKLEDLEGSEPILIDKDLPMFEKAIETRLRYRSVEMYTDEFDKLESELEALAQDLADLITKRFTNSLESCLEEEYQLDYFIEFYAHERLSGAEYINLDSENYILYNDVSYTENYS